MSSKKEILSQIKEACLVPVLRASSPEKAVRLARAAAEGGVFVMEVTMTVPDAVSVIRTLVKEDPEMLIGAGTVLDAETAKACIAEGAKFIVSPALNLRTVEYCREMDIAVFPGSLTPTEIVTAWQAGADVVKVFPAGAMGGAKYLKSLKAPLPQIEMIPTGGVTVETAHEFLAAGAFGLGVGADLMDESKLENGGVTAKAREYMAAVKAFREK